MKYDFETTIERRSRSSSKWLGMYRAIPDMPEDFIPFSVADLDLKIAPEIKEGLLSYLEADGCFGYTTGDEAFYDAVIKWMKKRHDWDIDREWIVNTSGVMHAINIAINEFCDEGGGVILFSPVYPPFSSASLTNKRKVIDCPMLIEDGIYKIDFDSFIEIAKDPNNKILLFCSPHNPGGRIWTKEELERVYAICKENDVLLISDEIHADFVMPGNKHYPLVKVVNDAEAKLIACTAPSKSFNLAGLQLSNIIITNPDIRERFEQRHSRSGVESCNSFSYKACELAYNSAEAWLDELIELVWGNYLMLVDYLKEHFPTVKVFPLQGTYLVWMDWSSVKIPGYNIVDFIMQQAKVCVSRGETFSERCSDYFRMHIACPREALLAGLERIRKAVAKAR